MENSQGTFDYSQFSSRYRGEESIPCDPKHRVFDYPEFKPPPYRKLPRWCTECKTSKEVDQFDGASDICKDCEKKARKPFNFQEIGSKRCCHCGDSKLKYEFPNTAAGKEGKICLSCLREYCPDFPRYGKLNQNAKDTALTQINIYNICKP